MENDVILECRDVTKSYVTPAERVEALSHLDVLVHRGEFVVIYGPSGSGKTTLLNLLSGLDRPDSGEILCDEKSYGSLSDRALTLIRRTLLGVIFQSFELVPVMSCFDNIEYPLVLRGVKRSARRKKVEETAELLEIGGLLRRRPREISGGQQQRVAIARTLVGDPEVVLGDEISGNLDSRTSHRLFSILKDRCERTRQTYVIVTHDPELERFADRTLHIQDGRFVDGRSEA